MDSKVVYEKYIGNQKVLGFFVKNRHRLGEVEIKQNLYDDSIKLNDGVKKDSYTSLLTALELAKYFHNFIKRGNYNFRAINYQISEDNQTRHRVFLITEKKTDPSRLEIFASIEFSEFNQ